MSKNRDPISEPGSSGSLDLRVRRAEYRQVLLRVRQEETGSSTAV